MTKIDISTEAINHAAALVEDSLRGSTGRSIAALLRRLVADRDDWHGLCQRQAESLRATVAADDVYRARIAALENIVSAKD